MSYSINRRPLLWATSDSEFEGDLETEVDDPTTSISDEKPFFKPYEPHDKYVLLLLRLENYSLDLFSYMFYNFFLHVLGIISRILYFIYSE